MKNVPQANPMSVDVVGHVHIVDDLGNVLLDQHNAVHPQNLARVFARALSNEPNYQIYRVALGNGGTTVSAGNTINYKVPNDGQLPDPSGWQSRLYNETYSEVIDDQSTFLGSGKGTSRADDPTAVPNISGPGVRSTEQGLISLVTVDVTLNANEPRSQLVTDGGTSPGNTENEFYFDELGLFTPGKSFKNTSGNQAVLLSNKNINANTGLATSAQYSFMLSINGGSNQTVTITTPATGSGISGGTTFVTYGDILPLINDVITPLGATASVSDIENGVDTGGNLLFTSVATGPNSTIAVVDVAPYPANWLFNHLLGYVALDVPVSGELAGVQNNAADPLTVRERLLTHIIFSPILKAANRTIRIVYTLTIAVARTQEPV
jgi:hypothetical protein